MQLTVLDLTMVTKVCLPIQYSGILLPGEWWLISIVSSQAGSGKLCSKKHREGNSGIHCGLLAPPQEWRSSEV